MSIRLPRFGLGAAPFGGAYRAVDQAEADGAVRAALELGMTLLDTSPHYGDTRSETVLGRALAGIPRQDYLLATKVGRYGDAGWDFSAGRVRRSVQESLDRLGVDRLDLVQCHDIDWGDEGQVRDEALPVLRELAAAGVVGAIGVTGYRLDVLERVALAEQVDTVMAYCTYQLQDRRLAPVAARLSAAGIGVMNAAPLAMGALTAAGPPAWHPAGAEILAAIGRAARVCAETGVDIASVALGFAGTAPAGINCTVVGAESAELVRRTVAALRTVVDPGLPAAVEAELAPVLNRPWEFPVPAGAA
ncbi:aldo/keto reductase [Nakamurella sp. YIM 132087]|uniref:Aldo/keto reductase n=1 Tax=Nakamurella alba TaxID=2665158 RepID=A0A7K1FGW1_9ACTN|nr:aldo/keto reductase [Nakamurella alba]MTD13361.1 aldo/keto reductase [Nakamurella alba]